MPVPRQNLLKGLKSIVFQRALALAQFLGLLLVLLKYLNFHQSFVLGVDVMQLDKLLIFGKERVQKLLIFPRKEYFIDFDPLNRAHFHYVLNDAASLSSSFSHNNIDFLYIDGAVISKIGNCVCKHLFVQTKSVIREAETFPSNLKIVIRGCRLVVKFKLIGFMFDPISSKSSFEV